MGNPNADPTKARQAKKARRRGRPGTVEDARRLLWRALERAADLLDVEGEEGGPDHTLALKAVHAISQGAAAYSKIVEVGELEARIEALEAARDDEGGPGPRLAKVGT